VIHSLNERGNNHFCGLDEPTSPFHNNGCFVRATLLNFPSDQQQATPSASTYQPELRFASKTI
jgi:hypothetical protein